MIILLLTSVFAFLLSFGFLYLYDKKAGEVRKMNGLVMFSFIIGAVSLMKLTVSQADGEGIPLQPLAGLAGVFSFWFWHAKTNKANKEESSSKVDKK